MDMTKTTFLVKGTKITENEIIFDLERNILSAKRSAKIGIVVGTLLFWVFGLGLIAVIIGLIQLKAEPIFHLKKASRYLSALSQQTGKPIVYVNLPPELQNYGKQAEDPQLQKGYGNQVEDPQLQVGKKFCPQCGKKIQEKGDFCTGCGIRI